MSANDFRMIGWVLAQLSSSYDDLRYKNIWKLLQVHILLEALGGYILGITTVS